MHRRIVESIQSVIEKSNCAKDVEVYIQPLTTGGFWKMVVIADEGKEYWLPHLESVSMAIGRLNGEGLWKRIHGRVLQLS